MPADALKAVSDLGARLIHHASFVLDALEKAFTIGVRLSGGLIQHSDYG